MTPDASLGLCAVAVAVLGGACVVYDESLLVASATANTAGASGGDGMAPPSDDGAAVGGVAGGGGSPVVDATDDCPPVPDRLEVDVITSMETGPALDPDPVRNGAWFAFKEATAGAFMQPAPNDAFIMSTLNPRRGGSRRAVHARGQGFTDWGAGVGFELAVDRTTQEAAPYNASRFDGVVFWARSALPGTALRLEVTEPNTHPSSGVCDPPNAFRCGDNPGASVPLSEGWCRHYVDFGALAQRGLAGFQQIPPEQGLNTGQLYSVVFTAAPSARGRIDFWIDDVSFAVLGR